jgi:hypothetical protein
MKKNPLVVICAALTMSTLLLAPVSVDAKSYSSRSSSSPSRSSRPSSRPSSSSSFKSSPSTTNTRVNSTTNSKRQTSFGTVNNASTPSRNVTATYKSMPSKSAITSTKPANAIVAKEIYKAPNPTNAPTEIRYESKYDNAGVLHTVRYEAPIGARINVPINYFPASVSTSPVVVYDTDGSVGNIVWGTIGGVIILIVIVAAFK